MIADTVRRNLKAGRAIRGAAQFFRVWRSVTISWCIVLCAGGLPRFAIAC